MKFSTQAIHIGQNPDPSTGAVVPPIYLTSTFVQESPGVTTGYDYTRAGNPNYTNLEKTLAALEQGTDACVYSSGLGALTALLSTLSAGDKVLACDDLYGGTYRLFHSVFHKLGIALEQIDFSDTALLEAKLKDQPKLLFIETPSNPLLKIIDIKTVTTLAQKYNVTSVIDNTFATPYFQQPLTLGADIVLHSSTKYLGGHSDLIGGALITNNKIWAEKFEFARKVLGLNPSPFDAWLFSRSLKTLPLRMKMHQENASAVAQFFEKHAAVAKVYYPGFSGMVSAEFNLSFEEVKKLISSFSVFILAESLGGVESLVGHPASMTHASIPQSVRVASGLSDGLVRFSVGIEDTNDLIDDLRTTLDKFWPKK